VTTPRHLRVEPRRFATRRNGRIAAASAAFLAVAATAGALMDPLGAPHLAPEGLAVSVAAQDVIGAQPAQAAPPAEAAPVAKAAPAADAAPPTPSAPASRSAPASPAPSNPDVALSPPPPPAAKVLKYTYEGQPNFYYCGPAATRIALTARNVRLSQDDLAARLGTTMNGTNSALDTTRVLNEVTKGDFYRTQEIRGGAATPAQMDRLQADAVRAISNGYAIVANVAGNATDADGGWHGYPGGHYVAVVGYRDSGRQVKIADPANPSVSSYWITTIDMANWMATRGYSG
jgi:hypothetical protein